MKVLLVQRRALGDALYTAFVAEVLKREVGAEVHLLTLSSAIELFSSYRYLDRVVPYGGLLKTAKVLRTERYNWLLDYEATFRTYPLALLSGAKRRVAFYRKKRERLLYPLYTDLVPYDAFGFTFWDRLKLLQPLGVDYRKYLGFRPRWVFKEGTKPPRGLPEGDYLVLAPKGVVPSKEVKPPLVPRLARELERRTGLRVVIAVAPGEKEYLRQLREVVAGKFEVFSRPLYDFAFLIKGARAVVSIESFPYHFALAVDVPSVVIVQGYPLFFKKTFGLIEEYRVPLDCVPCGGKSCKRRDYACTKEVDPAAVARLTENLLRKTASLSPSGSKNF
ncbi:MAG: glycosyltransferase family 9 protein [Aquificae bacterium]|nr:glycosyltransferase family 9 protein [Aquificota bacterium]